jgi:hypothetical protein
MYEALSGSYESLEEGLASPSAKSRRPPNAYILYCLEKRSQLRLAHPDLPNVEISKILGENWKSLNESDRRPYKEKAKTMQAEFKKENPEYRYDRARQKRITQEILLSRNRRPQMRPDYSGFPAPASDPLNYLYVLQGIAMGQPRSQPMFIHSTAAPVDEGMNSSFGAFATDYAPFASDLFDTR